jgi:hypothetical protein
VKLLTHFPISNSGVAERGGNVIAIGIAFTVSPLAHQPGFTTLPWRFFAALARAY